jgi:hypothetical protein
MIRKVLRSEHGVSLIETTIATSLLSVMMAGLLGTAGIATKFTENEGHLSARAAEYAQDKMEQLLALAWGDGVTDTTVFPAVNAGGTGLAVGGSLVLAAPAVGYVDYLDVNGNLLPTVGGLPPAVWFYKRVWKITAPNANLKQITVTATVFSSVGQAIVPTSSVAALKSNSF